MTDRRFNSRMSGRAVAVVAVVTVAAVGTLWYLIRKPGSYWTGELQRKQGNLSRSIDAFQAMGPSALPYLEELLQAEPSTVREWYADAYEKTHSDLKKLLPEPALDAVAIRARAVDVIGKLGANAKPAIPLLLKAATDPEVQIRMAAVIALGNLHAEATPDTVLLLSAALFDGSPFVRENACYALGRIGADAAEAVPVLTRIVQSNDSNMAMLAIHSLGKMGLAAKDALPVLADARRNGADAVRKAAALAIDRIEPARDRRNVRAN